GGDHQVVVPRHAPEVGAELVFGLLRQRSLVEEGQLEQVGEAVHVGKAPLDDRGRVRADEQLGRDVRLEVGGDEMVPRVLVAQAGDQVDVAAEAGDLVGDGQDAAGVRLGPLEAGVDGV